MSRTSTAPRIVGWPLSAFVVVAVIVVAELLFGAWFAAGTVHTELKVRQSHAWPVVEGVVTSYSSVTKSGTGGSYRDQRISYEFSFSQQPWQGNRKAHWPRNLPESLKPGQKVRVFVDPKSPEDSVLMLVAPFSNHATMSFLIGLALLGKGLFLLVAFWKALKSRRLILDRTAKWK